RADVEALLNVIVEGLWALAADRQWRLRPIGRRDLLPDSVAHQLRRITEATLRNAGGAANIAVAYDGRQDIISAVRSSIRDLAQSGATAQQIAEQLDAADIEKRLCTHGQPEPDLIIRTSGEQRLSGFMPWQAANAELYFAPAAWPNFTHDDFSTALTVYATRNRRFGL